MNSEVDKIVGGIVFDEQKLLELSTSHSLEHTYAADFRIGFRYGFNRGKEAGFKAALELPEVKRLVWGLEAATCNQFLSIGVKCRANQASPCSVCEGLKQWNEFRKESE